MSTSSPPLPAIAPRPLNAPAPDDSELRRHAIRGGAATGVAQCAKSLLNLGSTVLLARLLTPSDYGLFAMVTGFTGVIEMMKDGGLSLATVQREQITNEQISTLFWLNVALGSVFMLLTLLVTPLVIRFYGEPRLAGIMMCLAGTFFLSGLGVQHQALLRRHLRFVTLATIDVGSICAGLLAGVGLALRGHGYWALVGMAVTSTLVNTTAVWLASPWRPSRVVSLSSVRSMLGFGGSVVATRFVYQLARGSPNVLLGWYWGPAIVGIYQRAYALLMFTVDQILGPIALVVMPHLSRLQRQPARMKHVFLTGYRLMISAVFPIVATSAVFAEELVALLLGPQWTETAGVFRWLAASGFMVGLLNPQGLLLLAQGRAVACMRIGLVDAVVVVIAYVAGLRFGALGVAIGFFWAKLLLCVPLTVASFRGTAVTWRDVVAVVRAPLCTSLLAALGGLALKFALARALAPQVLAVVGCAVTLALYAFLLLVGARQWSFYRGLIEELRPRKPAPQAA